MTTRNLDAGIATYLQIKDEDDAFNTKQIVWGNVLRSLNADQAYRRKKRSAVKADAILDYLINDAAFPRSITHCLDAMLDSCQKLPNSSELQEKLIAIKQQAQNDYDNELIGEPLRDFLNDLQIALSDIHKDISETWFP